MSFAVDILASYLITCYFVVIGWTDLSEIWMFWSDKRRHYSQHCPMEYSKFTGGKTITSFGLSWSLCQQDLTQLWLRVPHFKLKIAIFCFSSTMIMTLHNFLFHNVIDWLPILESLSDFELYKPWVKDG